MSDDFDIILERKLESNADGAAGSRSEVRRIELITGTGRRRRWSAEDKARILVESFVPGVNVSEVARRNGLSPQQLFAWRREARALFAEDAAPDSAPDTALADRSAADVAPRSTSTTGQQERSPEDGDDAAAFVPVVIAARPGQPGRASDKAAPSPLPGSAPSGSPPPPAHSAKIEIVIGDTIVRVLGEFGGEVEAAALENVLVAVRRTS